MWRAAVAWRRHKRAAAALAGGHAGGALLVKHWAAWRARHRLHGRVREMQVRCTFP